ncbi:hypothetical protein GIB67_035912 [Kingdonia uniflora]|uniref:Uncharacterized protein n=1 Tax=Kingdonia uniflora TaxID=39325 RepID=A0A7J7P8K5_9MAGN|nr:hypothetical protein GIB67_035912 [Kingdonia uniflora]
MFHQKPTSFPYNQSHHQGNSSGRNNSYNYSGRPYYQGSNLNQNQGGVSFTPNHQPFQQNTPYVPPQNKKPSSDDGIQALLESNNQLMQQFMEMNQQSISRIETSIAQLASGLSTRGKGHMELIYQICANTGMYSSKDELLVKDVELSNTRVPHGEVSMRSPEFILLSMSLPTPHPETVFFGGLPSGVLEAIKEAYGVLVQILDPPKDGYNPTMKFNLEKLPQYEEEEYDLLVKIASLREVVLGAPLRVVLKHLALKKVAADVDQLVALVHWQNESFPCS